MGHREDLLAGAKRCLLERGYGRTTARDIVAASGTNLASIGYHFGSKEALLDAALAGAIEEWADRLGSALRSARLPAKDPVARFEALWTRVIDAFDHHRPLWVATFEALAQAERSPEVRRFVAELMQRGRERLAQALHDGDATADDASRARTVGALQQALMLGVMAQWLVDPERAPTARELATGLRASAGAPGQTRPRASTARQAKRRPRKR
ncbi:MAG TPA: TetR/AcrR family transcriptional regulator [Gemmatimonadaceae bacterium]|nr:TetR/AcrR family transcriptional regulator [Gemmatimonadaceae bacterium]